jgi:hypothetical protein
MDPGFQVRRAHLKKLRRAEGGAKIFGVFRVKNHDLTPNNHIFVKKVFKKISNMTKFYCPNKSIYYFFKINTKISTSFLRSMLISF